MEEFFEQPIGVYIKTNADGYITEVGSDAFIKDLSGWTKIDEGYGDKYRHAQSQYFKNPLINDNGEYNYKYENEINHSSTNNELNTVTVPDNVISIDDDTFNNYTNVIKYDFSNHTTVPILYSTNAFNGINTLCKIIVPDALYDEWIAATNWSTYADYIYKASEVTE